MISPKTNEKLIKKNKNKIKKNDDMDMENTS
jgi:hypothetical protein